jgi:hypothetical protein
MSRNREIPIKKNDTDITLFKKSLSERVNALRLQVKNHHQGHGYEPFH